MNKKIILLFLIISYVGCAYAQDILLERDINESVYVKKKGPNKNRFMHLYYDYSVYMPEAASDLYKPLNSFRSFIGIRNYYRIANSYIMGFAVEFGWENFRIKQDNQKTFPSEGIHEKETLGTSNLGLEYFNRVLLTQKESSLGIWMDVGIYTNLNLGSRHVIKDKASSTDDARYHKQTDKGLKYLNDWEYGLKARLGYKRYAILGTYRLSNWMSGSSNNYEPSGWSLGIELGLY